MKAIGVTGGIGCGKTSFCDILSSFGAVVFNSDVEARKLQDGGDVEVVRRIKAAFGDDIYDGDKLKRQELAKIVFADKSKLDELNAIIHPAIKKIFKSFRKACLEKGNVPLLVKEASILFEAETADELDAVVVVTVPMEQRFERLKKKGVSRYDAEQRMKHQLSDEERVARADYVIKNDGTLDDLEAQAKSLWKKLLNPA